MTRLVRKTLSDPARPASKPREIAVVSSDEIDRARAELLIEAVAEVATRAQRYVQEPAEAAWHDLLGALTRTYGDSEAYDLLRAVEIHARIGSRRW